MRETRTESALKSMPPAVREIPSSESQPQSTTSKLVASTSMSLIDDSAAHLFGLMKGLTANRPPADVQAFDPERVQAAVNCAKAIHQLMRLKLDAIKLGHEMGVADE